MIEKKGVIQIKVPYPDIGPGFAARVHTYICAKKVYAAKRLVECRSMKLSAIIHGAGAANYIIESPNLARNPFTRTTLIDCDKLFIADIEIPQSLLATPRPDVSQKLFDEIADKLSAGMPSRVKLTRGETAALARRGQNAD